jgi:hypothetical protein
VCASVSQADATTWSPGWSDGHDPAHPDWDLWGGESRYDFKFDYLSHDDKGSYFWWPESRRGDAFGHFWWPEFKRDFKFSNIPIYCFFLPFPYTPPANQSTDCNAYLLPTPLPGALPLMGTVLGIGFLMSAWAKRSRAQRLASSPSSFDNA